MGKDSKKIMSDNIKYYMERKGVTNQQLCEDLGFKYTTFIDWIKGVTYPRIGKVELMANYFGVLKSDLIEERTPERIKMQKKNDALTDIVVRLRTDEEYATFCEKAGRLSPDQFASVMQVVDTFLAMKG